MTFKINMNIYEFFFSIFNNNLPFPRNLYTITLPPPSSTMGIMIFERDEH